MKAARDCLRQLNLQRFRVGGSRFRLVLDRETLRLQSVLPKTARHWGMARKLLNIFLRDCFYTGSLNSAYRLSQIEDHLEIPLDSITAKALKQAAGRGRLPRWPGVKHLTPEVSDAFQAAGHVEARRQGISRVHLDAVWWSLARDTE